MDILSIALKKKGSLADAGIKYASLPGEASMSSGVSYFVANKRAMIETLNGLNISSGAEGIINFCSVTNKDFINIFNNRRGV